MDREKTRKQIRGWTLFVMFAIIVSGITAFPIQSELEWVMARSGSFPQFLKEWLAKVEFAVRETNLRFPFLAYGTDWLAFAHIIIALLFIGVLKDPVRNRWVIEWAMLCCVLVFPLAFIAGAIRGIPFFHQLIDCSFGVFGMIPLLIIRKKIIQLESLANTAGN